MIEGMAAPQRVFILWVANPAASGPIPPAWNGAFRRTILEAAGERGPTGMFGIRAALTPATPTPFGGAAPPVRWEIPEPTRRSEEITLIPLKARRALSRLSIGKRPARMANRLITKWTVSNT